LPSFRLEASTAASIPSGPCIVHWIYKC
jgi:hypothetical protein